MRCRTPALATTASPAPEVNLHDYDLVLLNTSAGKDSQAMITHVVELADAQRYPRHHFLAVHANLGRVEWPGTRELAERQAEHYSIRFEEVRRERGDLLEQIEARRKFPSSTARYCTSDQKTSQVVKLMTREAAAFRGRGHDRPIRILNCLGLRAEESPARAKKSPLGPDPASNGRRDVTRWLPIFDWTEVDVWQTIGRSGVPYHPAYAAGIPRLSCVFCVLAGRKELVLAARLNPRLAQNYVRLEAGIGHTFKPGLSMAEIVAEARATA
ncbi:hypothetical protein GCM10027258_80610 [Amycolatopsis stemonae]